MSQLGDVESVHVQSKRNAYIVFKNLHDACAVVERQWIVHGAYRIFVGWYHANLKNTVFYREDQMLKSRIKEIGRKASD